MPPIPDGTIFMLRDEGDRSVGIAPVALTLTYEREIDRAHFWEVLSLLGSIAEDEDWHGQVTAYVLYAYGKKEPEVQLFVPRYFESRSFEGEIKPYREDDLS